MKLPEKLLHFIWRYKLINQMDMTTTQDELVRILDFGQLNTNAGADFEYAKVQIHDRIWVGNIELHVSSLDWIAHQHHLDPRYNSTILHVVWEDPDRIPITRLDGTIIPTLLLKDYVDHTLLEKYQRLMENEQWIACENQLHYVSKLTIANWLDRLVVERLESKLTLIEAWAKSTGYDWEKMQFIALSRAFGMKVNSEAFEKLMLQMNTSLLYRYSNSLFKIEALLFGCSGFLGGKSQEEDYYSDLQTEFEYLRHLHSLHSLSAIEWKFLRMRPYNFPTFRLAQFCGLLHHRSQWFEFVKTSSLEELMQELDLIEASEYWKSHFHFHKLAKPHDTTLTNDFMQHIVLNAFVPLVFAYGKYIGDVALQQKAVDWLHELHAEKNTIVSGFKNLHIKTNTAGESQALLHLYQHYCVPKKCLDCAIGFAVLNR